jgi:hypothetical protein
VTGTATHRHQFDVLVSIDQNLAKGVAEGKFTVTELTERENVAEQVSLWRGVPLNQREKFPRKTTTSGEIQ